MENYFLRCKELNALPRFSHSSQIIDACWSLSEEAIGEYKLPGATLLRSNWDLWPTHPSTQLTPPPFGVFAKTELGSFCIFLSRVSCLYLSALFHLFSFFLLPFAFFLPCFTSSLFRSSCSYIHTFIHSLFFPSLNYIKILATAKYNNEEEHLPFYKLLQLQIHVHISENSACFNTYYLHKTVLDTINGSYILYLYVFLMYSHELSWQDAICVANLSRVTTCDLNCWSFIVWDVFVLVLSFFNGMLLDGAAKVQVNLFVRSITTISDIKMVSQALTPDWLKKVML